MLLAASLSSDCVSVCVCVCQMGGGTVDTLHFYVFHLIFLGNNSILTHINLLNYFKWLHSPSLYLQIIIYLTSYLLMDVEDISSVLLFQTSIDFLFF